MKDGLFISAHMVNAGTEKCEQHKGLLLVNADNGQAKNVTILEMLCVSL